MKCIQVIGQGVAVRVPDHMATRLVKIGDAQYCAKTVWREWGKPEADLEKLSK